MNTSLKLQLEKVARRSRELRLWRDLAVCWTVAACVGFCLAAMERHTGWASSLVPVAVVVVGVTAALVIIIRRGGDTIDARELARQVEQRYPDLDGRLITAVQQKPSDGDAFGYLQERLLGETQRHADQNDWVDTIPETRVRLAQAAHWLALAFFGVALLGLRVTGGHRLLTRGPASGIEVTPGDISLERGSSLVVLARFGGPLPPTVDLVVGRGLEETKRISLVKSLADPIFGGSVTEVASNLVYHVEYAGGRTRDFHVIVFEHPRLERADAGIVFPEYARKAPQHIDNTRRVSAVTGSRLDLTLQLNKPVVSARLVARDKEQSTIQLVVQSNAASAALSQFPLDVSQTYDLRLVDTEGRTNKVQSQFVFDVFTNRTPEMRLTWPHGDLRPSPLEEITYEGTVWDDFGVEAFGVGYALVGEPTKFIELGRDVPGREKRSFQYVLRLEDLGVQPDQLVSWFVWADDIGPDGKVRRTSGDLYFAEVRPFEEIFREGESMNGSGGQNGGSQGGGQTGRLADLQKQIMSATWKLQHEYGGAHSGAPERPASSGTGPRSENRHLKSERGISEGAGTGRVMGFPSPKLMGQPIPDQDTSAAETRSEQSRTAPQSNNSRPKTYPEAATIVRDSQAQALEQAQSAGENQQDPRTAGLWTEAVRQMEAALAQLNRASNSPALLPQALAAEQAAYQQLLKLQAHEYQVSRSRNRNQQGGGRNQQMQQQLQQLDLTQAENRYETQRQAQTQPDDQRREPLQVMSRLQDLARRQQDLNDRLKELQSVLQEARSEAERTDAQRRLQRLEEEEQQVLSDIDELRQRMDQPENQSRMADERRQLDQTRDDVQRAAQAAAQGAASQALAAGTRAQSQFQQIRDQMRKENSGQFSDDLREMRNEARELGREQEAIAQSMEAEKNNQGRSLSDSAGHQATLDQLARQKERLTNLVERAAQMSQQAEETEPLLSHQLYDTVRKFTQESTQNLKESEDELLQRGLMTEKLYNDLKDSPDPDSAKLLDLTREMLRQEFLPEAAQTGRRARAGIDQLKSGVEQAANSVLGDDTEALRLAQQELNQLTDQLQREIARAAVHGGQTNQGGGQAAARENTPDQSERSANSGTQPGNNVTQSSEQSAQNESGNGATAQAADGTAAANNGGGGATDWDRILNDNGGIWNGPLTGTDYLPWSDHLRDVEEMIELPGLRNDVARIRERARQIRQAYKHDGKKPDWAVVRLQVVDPLAEVRDRIADELSRRASSEALVPIDRDPVPNRYSDLVRHYYEELGKDK